MSLPPYGNSCSLCKHYNGMLSMLRREPFFGAVPCTSCTRLPDSRTDKFEQVSKEHVDKQYRAFEER